ncbi:MAG: efflux RND transporter periplasmic adaptor subunit [Syntrophales bacterium]|jgi:membrane fusion protein (multidrug efflux system)|nr:efflux RND transporter periplasmic adaptor subunit [Syntrophales bacterium]MCK9392228.1 efflux RND transporter periplasmic adaptor subunit [Syntrophales bacterium]
MQIHNIAKQVIIVGGLTAFLILTGCGQSSNKAPAGGPPEVAVVTIQPQRVVITTELAGRTSANLVAEVRPQVGGIIQKRLFTEGADVKAGQVLFKIDPAHFQAIHNNAQAALGRSEANLSAIRLRAERMQELVAEKAVSQQEYDDAAAALKQNQADIQFWKATVETASINLKYSSVTAPISGRIGKSSVTEGALVTANQPLPMATIQRLDPMYVDVAQSTTELMRLRRRLEDGRLNHNVNIRNKVHVLLEDNTRYQWEGVLQFRDVTVDPTTGSVTLRVVVPNPKGFLLPGMFVRAELEEGVNEKALLVPQQAVTRDPKGNPLTFTVDAQGKVQQREIKIDRAIGDKWLVSSGLTPGERVIVEGIQKVKPGASVMVVPFVENAGKTGGADKPAAPPAKAN